MRVAAAAVLVLILTVLHFDSRDAAAPVWPVTFTDAARDAGLTHSTTYGGVERKRFIIETNGSGVALVDVDRDGWLDVLVLSGTRLQEGARKDVEYTGSGAPTNRLYRNRRDGTFEDITDKAGIRRTAGHRPCAPATTTTTD